MSPRARCSARRGRRRSIIPCSGWRRTHRAPADGVARPILYKGEQVGESRHFDERLTMFLLRTRRPDRYGKWMERMLAPSLTRTTLPILPSASTAESTQSSGDSRRFVDIEDDDGPGEARDDANKGEAERA